MPTSPAPSRPIRQALRAAVADLEQVNPWVGVGRFGILGGVFLGLVWLAWSASDRRWMMGLTAIAGVFYAFWLICTHDTTHGTLTGWSWFDRWMPRLMSYPMLWPYGTYAQLHHLHHAWNGTDLRDPERVQWTIAEYNQAPGWQRWYVRHQWSMDIFVLGGIGLILKTVLNGWRFRSQVPALQRLLLLDGVGIILMQTGFAIAAIAHGRLLDYLLFWLILERAIGILIQARDHLEHYALWGTFQGHQLTQLYACRNVHTPPLVAWLVGGLNDHAIHHAFPTIPFHHLPEAFCRVQAVLQQHHLPPMERGEGYLQETLRLGAAPLLIGEMSSDCPTGRSQMVTPSH